MNKKHFLNLLERYEKGTATEQEKKQVEIFFKSFEKEPTRLDSWDFNEIEKIRLDIYGTMRRRIVKTAPYRNHTFLAWRIAASVAILLSIGIAGYYYAVRPYAPNYITKTTLKGQNATITLSDGSTVNLNANSSITFPEKFEGATREINLTGEAFLTVRKNKEKPFSVSSGDLVTTVLGTSFNINSYSSDQTVITLSEGKVMVAYEGERKFLNPGEQAVFDLNNKKITTKEIDLEYELSWTKGIIQFNETPFTEVVQTLERWYDTDIILENDGLSSCTISGKFKESRINNVLEGLKFLIDIEYETEDYKEIYISGQGCR